ncbi:MAG TPA: rhomboid family intramembrane serine protease [Steroidobacteraceae bacterium]|nr:rhomboid family intramembrane serine protease [Steroidobacteraceae bacterium]
MFRTLTPIVRALLYVNLIAYGLEWLTGGDRLLEVFALWPLGADRQYGAPPFEPWQLVTYAFLHDPSSIWHLLGNMFALYMFGPDAERTLGARRFTIYYFACVIGAGLAQLWVVYAIAPGPYETIGASGGIFGLLLFYGMTFPRRQLLLLFPPVPMPAWLFVTLYGILELSLGVFGRSQGVAHFAHLGGMATGFGLILFWRSVRRSDR